MCFGALYSFSSVLLLSRGYKSAEIGLILAMANLLAVIIQPFLADFADRKSKTAIFKIMIALNAVILGLSFLVAIFKERSLGLTLSFLGVIATVLLQQPFANAVNRRLEETGARIQFGICRSAGSFFYAVMCLLLGLLVERKGTGILPYSEVIVTILFTLAILGTYRGYLSGMRVREGREKEAKEIDEGNLNREISAEIAEARTGEKPERNKEQEEINLITFIRTHKMFLLLSLGTLGLYFSNSTINMYMAQIANNLGGNSEDIGRVFSLLAFMEIPTLILFDKLYQRFRCENMLKFSAVFFVLWAGSCAFAKTVGMLLGAQIFQMFAFALYLPSMVRFIDDNMKAGEAIKGQTLFTTVTTSAAVFAGLLGGRIIDSMGIGTLTFTATVITAIGTILVFLTVNRAGNREVVSKDLV